MNHPLQKILNAFKQEGFDFEILKTLPLTPSFSVNIKNELSKFDIPAIVAKNNLTSLFWGHDPVQIIMGLQFSYKDHLLLVSYGKEIQIYWLWNDVTKQSRWVIIDMEDLSLNAHPFDKFFNVWEWGIPEVALETIPTHIPFEWMEKLDGALWILYKNRDGSFAIATKWSFYSDEAQLWTAILKSMYSDKITKSGEDISGISPVFEIVSSKFPHVVDYGNTEDLFLIGARDMKTGKLLLQEELNNLSTKFWFSRPEKVKNKHTDLKSFVESVKWEKWNEWYVLYFDNGLITKVKTEDYIRLHKLHSDFNINVVLENLRDGTLEEFKLGLEEEFLEDFNKYLQRINAVFKFNFNKSLKLFNNLIQQFEGKDRREFFAYFESDIKGKISKLQWSLLLDMMTKKYTNKDYDENSRENYDRLLKSSFKYLKPILKWEGVTIMSWVPGSGKSTSLKNLVKPEDILISTDEIRMELLWNYQDQTQNWMIFAKFQERLESNLQKKIQWEFDWSIYLDATSINKKDRESILHTVRKYWVTANCIYMNIHPELAIERDGLRKWLKDVGEKVIYRIFNKLEVPTYNESFDNITQVEVTSIEIEEKFEKVAEGFKKLVWVTSNKMEIIEKDIFPYLYEYVKSEKVEQKSEYHDETVGEHIYSVVKNSVEKWFNNDVIAATIFHDLWKLYARRYNPEFGRYTFDWHGDVSVKILEIFHKKRLSKVDGLDYENIKEIVKYHNFFDRLWRKLEKAEEKQWVNSTFDKDTFLKKDIETFIEDNWFDKKFCIDLFQHWMCDKEWAKRNEVQLKKYLDFKNDLERVIDYNKSLGIIKEIKTIKPGAKSFKDAMDIKRKNKKII